MKKFTFFKIIFQISILSLAFFLTVCGSNGGKSSAPGDADGNFICVTDISLVSRVATAKIPLILDGNVEPDDATNYSIIWSISEEDDGSTGATITNGILNTTADGTVEVLATVANGAADGEDFTKPFTIIVNADIVDVTGVSLNKTTHSIIKQAVLPLTAAVEPVNATNQNVTWSSGNTKVATVDNKGKVSTLSAGTAVITVTTKDGAKIAQCTVTVKNSLMETVWIKPGSFMMGSPTTEANRQSNETQHPVTLTKGYYMTKYQVTQGVYTSLMGKNPSYFNSNPCLDEWQEIRPVEQVNWYDAIVFSNKLSSAEGLEPVYSISGSTNPSDWGAIPTSSNATWNKVVMDKTKSGYHLPTEAEWEYACRAGTTTAYNTGAAISNNTGWYSANSSVCIGQESYHCGLDLCHRNVYSGQMTHAVGMKPANAWGLYDMHGNVWEWCWDWNGGDYGSGAQTDPTGSSSGAYRVMRGGAFDWLAQYLRSACRGGGFPGDWSYGCGFRLVRQ